MPEIIGPPVGTKDRVSTAELHALMVLGVMDNQMFLNFMQAVISEKRKNLRWGEGPMELASKST